MLIAIGLIKTRKLTIYILFVLFLLLGRFLWTHVFFIPGKTIQNGELQFERFEELANKSYFINNVWDNPLIPEEKNAGIKAVFSPLLLDEAEVIAGTYHVLVKVPPEPMILGLHFANFSSKDEVFINDECVFTSLNEVDIYKMERMGYFPHTLLYEKEEGIQELDVKIKIGKDLENSPHRTVRGVVFGDAKSVVRRVNIANSSEALTALLIMFIGIFSLGLYVAVKRNKLYLYFGFSLLSLSGIILLGSGEKVLQQLLKMPNVLRLSIMSSLVYIFCYSVVTLVDGYQGLSKNKWLKYFQLFLLCMSVTVLIIPSVWVFKLSILYKLSGLFSLGLAMLLVERNVSDNQALKLFLMFALISSISDLIWLLYRIVTGVTLPYYPFDLIIAIFCLLLSWFQNYKDLYGTMDHLNASLIESSQSKKELLTKATLKLNEPLNDMLSIIDHTLKKEDAVYLKNDLIRLEGMNKEAIILIENIMDIMTDNMPLEDTELESLCLHDKIDYCCKMIKKEEKFASFEMDLLLTRRDDYILGDFKSFVQMIYQIFALVQHSMSEGRVIFSDRRETDRVILEVTLKGCIIESDVLEDLSKTVQENVLEDSLFTHDLSIPVMRIKQLVDFQGGGFRVDQQKNDVVLLLDFQASDKPNLQYDEYEYLKNYRLSVSQGDEKEKNDILVISNNIKQLIVIKELLESDTSRVYIADSFEEGQTYIDNYPVDLVVSDVLMSHTTGYEGTAMLRKRFNMIELPILLVATNKYKLELDAIYASGANDYIEKPIDGNELQIKVRTLLEMKESIASAIHYEASWLQAQIEPHFLFNTLNTIISLSTYDEEAMHEVLDAFMLLLHRKYKYSGSNDLITLKDELDLVESYLVIEKARFGDKIEVVWNIDPEVNLEQVDILPLTIQPLVENGIKHGILPLEGKGVLTITVQEKHGEIEIRILDNGLGTTLTLDEILSQKMKTSSGIGLRNTYHRLKKIMGVRLTFHSEQNQGTELIFHLKAEVGGR